MESRIAMAATPSSIAGCNYQRWHGGLTPSRPRAVPPDGAEQLKGAICLRSHLRRKMQRSILA